MARREKMKKLIVIRHALKDKDARKDMLSEKGRAEAHAFKFPKELDGLKIVLAGGTELPRTYTTASLIIDGNNLPDVRFLASDGRFGSMDSLGKLGWDSAKFGAATKAGKTNIAALKDAMTADGYAELKRLLKEGIDHVFSLLNDGEAAMIVSHDPWVPLVLEIISGETVDKTIPELGYIVLTK